jgi:predicted ABC-type ATPase
LLFLWVPDADFSVRRVAERVLRGGHNIPEETIRRRYQAGIKNFFSLYMALADAWGLYVNTVPGARPTMIAESIMGEDVQVYEPHLWQLVQQRVSDG